MQNVRNIRVEFSLRTVNLDNLLKQCVLLTQRPET